MSETRYQRVAREKRERQEGRAKANAARNLVSRPRKALKRMERESARYVDEVSDDLGESYD